MPIAYMSGSATSKRIGNEIDYLNLKLKKRGKRKQFKYEGTGSPMRWTLWETTNHGDNKILVNASNKEIWTYIQGMLLILTIV